MTAAGRRVRVMPQLKVEQGIQAARTIFGKCYFDAEKCADGIQALRHYRYEVDEKLAGLRKDAARSTLPRGRCVQDGGGDDSRAGAQEGAGEAQAGWEVIRVELRHPLSCPGPRPAL